MIHKVVLRRFKRFANVELKLPGHIVLAGPNNTGKTTLLQAIAVWGFTLNYWKQGRTQYRRYGRAYQKVPLIRADFAAVPLRNFDLLWNDREHNSTIEIEVHGNAGWRVTMEILYDTPGQVYVRPLSDVAPEDLSACDTLQTVHISPMSGIGPDEPVLQQPMLDWLLGQGKPGDIIRNLLVKAYDVQPAWFKLQATIHKLFGYELHPPDSRGAHIRAEYSESVDGPRFDIASAGSGFQQVLMLLTFLHTNEGSILLLDEPDAHLHIILQDSIYSELRSAAREWNSQLVVATHSEVIINSVEPKELCMVLDQPRLLDSKVEREQLAKCMAVLPHTDIMLALQTPGILYTEAHTDLAILRAWADVLAHPMAQVFATKLFWRAENVVNRLDGKGIGYKDHFEALKLIHDNIRGLFLADGDGKPPISGDIAGAGLQYLRWKRYEIESYLVHPQAIARFISRYYGPGPDAETAVQAMFAAIEVMFPGANFVTNPTTTNPLVEAYFRTTKARKEILPPLLAAANIYETEFPYTRYNEIAILMLPEDIHPEVVEKLDGIQKAFGL